MKKSLVLLLLIVGTFPLFGQSFKIIGYLPDYRWSYLNSIDFSKTTHVLAAFGNPDSSGTLSFAQDIDLFASKVHAGDAKALLSIGGGGDYSWGDNYHTYEYLFTSTRRTPFIMKIMDYTRLHQLDGIDLDIEGNALQLSNYNVFAQELADSLHLAGLLVGASFFAEGSNWPTYVSTATLSKLDFLTAQSYGGVGDWNWNNPTDMATFKLFKDDITFWKSRGLSKDQIIGGLPFYVVEFPQSAQSSYWQYEPDLCSVYTGSQYASQHPLTNDLVYASNGDRVYLNSLTTFRKKIDYAVGNAGGIMIWELGEDCYNGTLNILDSLSSYATQAILSVKDKQTTAAPKFYPNPANALLLMEGLDVSVKSYSIQDVFGREIQSGTLSASFIDVSKLETGMYFIIFKKEESSLVPIPLMIQR